MESPPEDSAEHQDERGTRRELAIAGMLLALGALLRLYGLNDYPLGVHQDELSDIYDGYSILQTGADRFGDMWPLQLRAFGENDFRPAMYAWLTVIPLKVFGFSVAAGRLPSAIFGTASLAVIYAFARRIGGGRYGLVALTLAVLSPLHIQYSRLAHQGTILPGFFLIVTLFAWHVAASTSYTKRTFLLGFATGLFANPYQSTKLMAFLLAIVIGFDIVRTASSKRRALSLFAAGAVVGAAPQILALISDPYHFFARARVLAVAPDSGSPFVWDVFTGFLQNLAPRYLFFRRDIFDLTVARLLPPEILFFYVGLIGLALMRILGIQRARWAVYVALIVAILPAALTTGNPNTLRASGLTVLSPLISAAGIVWLYERFVALRPWRSVYYPIVAASLFFAAFSIIRVYGQSITLRESHFQNFLVTLGRRVGAHERSYDRVLLEDYGSQLHLYVAAFSGMPPRAFQEGPRDSWSDGMDHFRGLGKYRFLPLGELERAVEAKPDGEQKTLFVATRVLPGLIPIDSVAFQQEKEYLMVRPE